jgi:cytochrome b6-f complex subunit 6
LTLIVAICSPQQRNSTKVQERFLLSASSVNDSIILINDYGETAMFGVVAYVAFLALFFGIAVGLLFGLRAAKII